MSMILDETEPTGRSALEPLAALPEGNYGIDAVAALVASATSRLQFLGATWRRCESAWRQQRSTIVLDGKRAVEALDQEQAEAPPLTDVEEAGRELAAAAKRALARVAKAGTNVRRALRARLEQDLEALANSPNAGDGEIQIDPQLRADLEAQLDIFLTAMGGVRTQVSELDQRFTSACARIGVGIAAPAKSLVSMPSADLNRCLALIREDGERLARTLGGVVAAQGYQSCTLGGRILLHGMLLLPPGLVYGAMALLWPAMGGALLWSGGAALLLQALAAGGVMVARRRTAHRLARLRPDLAALASRLDLLGETARRQFDPLTRMRERRAISQAQERSTRAEGLRTACDRAVAASKAKEERLRRRIESGLPAAQEALRRRVADEAARRQSGFAAAKADLEAEIARQVAALDEGWDAERARLSSDWSVTRTALTAGSVAGWTAATTAHPPWSDAGWSTWEPVTTPATAVLIGQAERAVTDIVGADTIPDPDLPSSPLVVPVALTGLSSLLVHADGDSRDSAITLANQVVLRALTAFPAGRLKLTLVDPIGLGSALSGLLDLADHDESLIQGGVLVDPGRIERGIDDLLAHVEVVIQKYLRGRYATIEDYNREAGELQEAQRLLVVADFPAGFSERTLERLGVLLRSGPRCGVHMLILHDARRPLPPVIDPAWFRTNGLELRGQRGLFRIEREGLKEWRFLPQPAADGAAMASLLARIGRQAQRVSKVEVSFTAIAPPAEAMWSLSAARNLRIPIGKCGADRLQYFDLGIGTAQHALIGGRTGSGKSTLFHVLVTSASLWYAPREVEFHLIDFKKGVEFKTYATNHLPHARVIAIESDREFGLSVLRNLDQELTRRGDAFRRAGAHDLAAFRTSGGEFLPRVLLLIDEFQEFFTEDDAIARDAALLLDRFVRQGRAFGLHVVLGSQTLGGAYTMARSSLGQMGVRIALPCNEADAQLLLHEENDAARLLSRPGDGIYNDRAGMTAGNSPFQVCWLSESEESAHLRRIAERTAQDGWRARQRTVVFEGNGPSHLEDDEALDALLERGARPEDARMEACVGQASSLNGATHVTFPRAAGGNLLILGQNREAAATTCGAIILGLAARHGADGLRLLAIDGEDRDTPFAQFHERLAACLPQGPQRHEARGVEGVIGDLAALLERRQAGEDPQGAPVLLTVSALQRLRSLRPDDDAYGSGSGEPLSDRFARILANGPEYGIHTVVWCDSLASAQRCLNRRSMRDFDARILFQMSASDSGELIDDDSASRLGLHTALLSVLGEGRREKFRPFSLPEQAFYDRLAATIGRR